MEGIEYNVAQSEVLKALAVALGLCLDRSKSKGNDSEFLYFMGFGKNPDSILID